MAAWGNICRICSSPADHEIFAKIPTYLHASRNEFLKWQKPINKLIEETTGLKIASDDGLPKHICALCVSYLKHAVNFREQCINNALSFNFVLKYKELQRSKDDRKTIDDAKETLLIEEQDLNYSTQREQDAINFLANSTCSGQDKVSKALFDHRKPSDLSQQLHYLQKIFTKNWQPIRKRKIFEGQQQRQFVNRTTPNGHSSQQFYAEKEMYSLTPTSSEEMEENASSQMTTDRDIFTYKERNFIEDDIINVAELQDAVAVNTPERSMERKCEACLNRFMFSETYEEHKSSCIQLKLVKFVEEANQLVLLKNKEISTHEFIRRMIFSLRKICEWLIAHYGDVLLPDLPQNSKTMPMLKSNLNCGSYNGDGGGIDNNEKDFKFDLQTYACPEAEETEQQEQIYQHSAKGIINMSNNILLEIERSESHTLASPCLNDSANPIYNESNLILFEDTKQIDCLTPKREQNTRNYISVRRDLMPPQSPLSPPSSPLITLLNRDDTAPITPPPIKLTVTARCPPCGMAFDTLSAFEVHNALHHNGPNC